MNPVDLLGAKISIRIRIGMTHPYIEKCSSLSLPETPTVIIIIIIIIIIMGTGLGQVDVIAYNGNLDVPAHQSG